MEKRDKNKAIVSFFIRWALPLLIGIVTSVAGIIFYINNTAEKESAAASRSVKTVLTATIENSVGAVKSETKEVKSAVIEIKNSVKSIQNSVHQIDKKQAVIEERVKNIDERMKSNQKDTTACSSFWWEPEIWEKKKNENSLL